MLVLGLNAAFHDPSACLIKNGKVVAAVEEERFTHVKHGKRPTPFAAYELPFHAIDYCLREEGIRLADVDYIGYSFEPGSRLGAYNKTSEITLPLEPSANEVAEQWETGWDPYFLSSIVNAPRHLRGGVPHHLQGPLNLSPDEPLPKWRFVTHHLAHAASAFYPSPFNQAAVLTIDGRGETATTTYGFGEGHSLELLGQVDMPHSLGILYERLTTFLGFLNSSDEFKVMALASFGQPIHKKFFQDLISIGENGIFTVKDPDFENQFGPTRQRGSQIKQMHFDLASSLQVVIEETVLDLLSWLKKKTAADNLVMAGGVALNCVMNAKIRDQGPFKNVWVQPAAGDSGTALGAAIWTYVRESNGRANRTAMDHVFLGPSYGDDDIERFLQWSKIPYKKMDDIAGQTARLLADNNVIGWFQGRMEFGPRALGGRSILASPIPNDMQARLNTIKDREDFRPVAPVVLEEDAAEWFVNAAASPFMLFTYDIVAEKSEKIPAVKHIDGTARVQTINRNQNPLYYDLLQAFKKITGVPILVNTSFNTRGEPIVCTPRDAVESFWTSPLDALIIGSFFIIKPGITK